MKMRRENGPSDYAKMLKGLREAAEQIQREEFNKIVAPAPVQMRLPFMDDKLPELPHAKRDAPMGDALALTDHDRNFFHKLGIEIPDDARWELDGDASADSDAAI